MSPADCALSKQIGEFVDRVTTNVAEAPKWWRKMWLGIARDWIRRRPVNLLDAAEPFREWGRCRG